MKRISYWAKYHPVAARILIALIETALIILSIILGVLLLRAHVLLHQRVAEASLVLLALSVIFYPYHSSRRKQYELRKFLEFTVALSIFVFGCFMANRNKIATWNTYTPLMGHYIAIDTSSKTTVLKKEVLTKKEVRKKFKAWLKGEAKANNSNWVYIVLIILGGLALLVLLAALACSIGCAGDLTGAWLLGILGGAAIIFLVVWGITKVSKSKAAKIEKRIARIKRKQASVLHASS